MSKKEIEKPSVNYEPNAQAHGTTKPNSMGSKSEADHVGPQMVDEAPSALRKESKSENSNVRRDTSPDNKTSAYKSRTSQGAFTQTPPPNYGQAYSNYGQAPPPNYGGMPPNYGQAAAGGTPYYTCNRKQSEGWKKGLLVFGIILVVLVFLGYIINSFFTNLFYTGEYDSEYSNEIPDSSYIARIAVEGEITAAADSGYLASENGYDHQFTLDSIDDLISDSNNKALLLYVDTPGGGVYESDELYLKLREYQDKTSRPVYVSMGSMAASGGYYISAPANKIYANRNCWTGSIGVTMGTQFDISKLLKKYGIEAENLTSGRNKAMGSYVEPMTAEQRKIFQSMLDEAYNQFVGIIAEGRGMDINIVKELADGRIYTALQAQKNGLIDGIATEEETIQLLKNDNGLTDCEVVPIENYVEPSWLDEFLYAKVSPLIDRLGALGKGDLETALELKAESDSSPLKYMYE